PTDVIGTQFLGINGAAQGANADAGAPGRYLNREIVRGWEGRHGTSLQEGSITANGTAAASRRERARRLRQVDQRRTLKREEELFGIAVYGIARPMRRRARLGGHRAAGRLDAKKPATRRAS